MSWTNVSKPSTQTYTNVNPSGKEQYDQADVTYDSSTNFYDGANPDQWTEVQKVISAWDVSKAVFYQSFDPSAQMSSIEWFFFRADGLKLYIGDADSGDTISEYDLSEPWNISTAVFVQMETITGISYLESGYFSISGETLYVVDSDINDFVRQYSLSTPWDISTITLTQSKQITNNVSPLGLYFRPDGLQMYLTDSASDEVDVYNLSNAWDISTISYLQSFSVAAQTGSADGIFFKPDGKKFYIINGTGTKKIFEYTLSEAWDVSTASFSQSLTLTGLTAGTFSVAWSIDGTKLYWGTNAPLLNEYILTPQWTNVAKPT